MLLKYMFNSSALIFTSSILLRVFLFFYGLYQDANSVLKFTDIDYFVFTDAAKYAAEGGSPYDRDTYRYTPLLAWFLVPTSWDTTSNSNSNETDKSRMWFSFGKLLFAAADIVAGWLLLQTLRKHREMEAQRALKYASIWLLNPMVAVISTRGSSEGLLAAIVLALLWTVLENHLTLAGMLLGIGVHFKIYPFIYGPSILWMLDEGRKEYLLPRELSISGISSWIGSFVNHSRIKVLFSSLATFVALNFTMYSIYGPPFLQHTYLHHLVRVDHRHNFSPYNVLLYLSSSASAKGPFSPRPLESMAFLPQLLLSTILIPLVLAKKDLAGSMLAQTFAFVTFNKVCTSQVSTERFLEDRRACKVNSSNSTKQYFLWYMVFLPLYLPYSTFFARPRLGVLALVAWVVSQVRLRLCQNYRNHRRFTDVFCLRHSGYRMGTIWNSWAAVHLYRVCCFRRYCFSQSTFVSWS